MGSWWLIGILCASAAELGLAVGADGEPIQGADVAVLSLDVEALPLAAFVALVAEQTGLSIVVAAELAAEPTITAQLQGVPWELVLPGVLAEHGLALEQRGRVWVVVPLP